jgi:hypothetical protein
LSAVICYLTCSFTTNIEHSFMYVSWLLVGYNEYDIIHEQETTTTTTMVQ